MYMPVPGDRATHEVSGTIDAGRLDMADRWRDLALAPPARRVLLTQVATGRHESSVHDFLNSQFHVLLAVMSTVTMSHTEAVARLGYALSDDTRARILLALREAPAHPSDLADALDVSRQVMSNQLACLRGCGLVTAQRDGRHTWYRLADPHLAPALSELLRVVLFVDPMCCSPEGCTCT